MAAESAAARLSAVSDLPSLPAALVIMTTLACAASHCCCTFMARIRYCSAATESGSVNRDNRIRQLLFLLAECDVRNDTRDGQRRESLKIVDCCEGRIVLFQNERQSES